MIGITKLRILTSLIVAMCLTVSGCRTTSDPDPLLAKIPSNDGALALIEDPDQVLIDTMRWLERALGPAGRTISDRLRREGRRLLGFDPVTSKLSEKLNLNNNVGLALFSPADGLEPLLLAKTTKPNALLETLLNWYKRIDASAKLESRPSKSNAEILLHHFGKPFGKELVPVFIVRELNDGWFLAGGAQSATSLAAYQAPSREQSLAASKIFARQVSNTKPDIRLWAPPALLFGKSESPLNQATRGVLSSIDISPKGLQFVTEAPMKMPSFLDAMKTGPLQPLLRYADEKHFFVAATRLAQDATLKALSIHPPWQQDLTEVLQRATKETGLDIEKEVIPELNGDVLITAALSSEANLGALRRLNNQRSLAKLGSQFKGRIYLGIKDPNTMRALLLKGLKNLQQNGQPLRQRTTAQGYLIIEPDVTEPALGWAVGKSHYIYSLGIGELDKALQALDSPNKANHFTTHYGTKSNASIGVVRLAVLSQALRSMTSSGGLAPQLQGLVEPALSALERIGDVSLALEFTESSLRLSVTETLP